MDTMNKGYEQCLNPNKRLEAMEKADSLEGSEYQKHFLRLEKEIASLRALIYAMNRKSLIHIFSVNYGPSESWQGEVVVVFRNGVCRIKYHSFIESQKEQKAIKKSIDQLIDDLFNVGGWFGDIKIYINYRRVYDPQQKSFDEEDKEVVKAALKKMMKDDDYRKLFDQGYVEYDIKGKNVLILLS